MKIRKVPTYFSKFVNYNKYKYLNLMGLCCTVFFSHRTISSYWVLIL